MTAPTEAFSRPQRASHDVSGARLRIGVVGCGDVAHRRYLPALAEHKAIAEMVACCDPRPGAAEAATRAVAAWSPESTAFMDLESMLEHVTLDAVINLTPAPMHAAGSQACLEAGVNVYSEKPIASSLADAHRL